MYFMISMFKVQHCLKKIINQQNENQPIQIDTGTSNLGVLSIDFNPYWVCIKTLIQSEPKLWGKNTTMGGKLLYCSFSPYGKATI